MGEHLNGIQGVAGSIPVSSTNTSLRTAGGTCACGAPAIGSAGCGLDRSPGPVLALRSRGARLLPRLLRETTRAATGALQGPRAERTGVFPFVILSEAKDLLS